MASVEERAERYANRHAPVKLADSWLTAEQIREVREAVAAAYLAGSGRRKEYARG